tara:strand:- start:274 stop:834 length:561 start_codon:yes stop_codon:yes gene_type:complete
MVNGAIYAIAGPYSGAWNTTYLGVTEDGYELEHTFYSEPVRGDNLGDAIQDEIYRGADVYVNYTLMEHEQARDANGNGSPNSSPWWPQSVSGHNAVGSNAQIGVVGDSRGEYAASLVLSAAALTPAAALPATITFPYALLATNFPVRILYASRVRRVPMRMICYPVAAGLTPSTQYTSTIYYYSTT